MYRICSFVFPFTGFIWRKCHTKGNFESTGAHREVDAKTDREKVKPCDAGVVQYNAKADDAKTP